MAAPFKLGKIAVRDKQKDKLAEKIIDGYAKSRFDSDEKDFLPDGVLETLITPETILKELLNQDDLGPSDRAILDDPDNMVFINFIREEAPTIFAIAVAISLRGTDLSNAMVYIKDSGATDKMLPITDKNQDQINCFRNRDGPWDKVRIYEFRKRQWSFLVPVFSKKNFKHDLEMSCILPFIAKEEPIGEGAFGRVYKVDIHPAHLKNPITYSDGRPAKYAIKEFTLAINDSKWQKEAEDVWDSEVDVLNQISDLGHPNLIERIAAITRAKQRYLMFLWADGGNLRDFWSQNPNLRVDAGLVREVVGQIKGMIEALNKLHNWDGSAHFRHGDIKPENILRFPDQSSKLGTFKISDLGSAKQHDIVTRLRTVTGGKKFATIRYQAPEAYTNELSPSSRLYDMWSMGCVILEFMVWLLYGYEELTLFNSRVKGDYDEQCSFYTRDQVDITSEQGHTTRRVANIHPAVDACLTHLSQDPECSGNTALGDLLDIVRTKLLVIELPEQTESRIQHSDIPAIQTDDGQQPVRFKPFGKQRAKASAVLNALKGILSGPNLKNERYWYTGRNRDRIKRPSQSTAGIVTNGPSHLHEKWEPRSPTGAPGLKPPSSPTAGSTSLGVPLAQAHGNIIDRVNLSDDWLYPVDNEFATGMLTAAKIDPLPTNDQDSRRICDKCQGLDFLAGMFRLKETWAELKSNVDTCTFCRMRWEASKHLDQNEYDSVSWKRVESVLRMNDDNFPTFSILRSPDLKKSTHIQIGLPQIPGAGSEHHFKIIHHWLKNCDQKHGKFKCVPKNTFVPTRLIQVGDVGDATVRLVETDDQKGLQYMALSHPWGTKPPFFCTFPDNYQSFKQGIPVADLPATFRDAITTTRRLDVRYLWIDSLCIIQGPNGDFKQEAEKMEDVFSSAYCVLAASNAEAQSDGFLNPRKDRPYATFERDGQAPFYVCGHLDDFNKHVLKGSLSKRGWVMQERVLAHRTIYFTHGQTYWECGEAVRCETLVRTENKMQSFFGDPNFPDKISSNLTNRGEKIKLYEGLYRQYSRLAFTRWEDRPIAISGLQRRLIDDLHVRGDFGVFDDGKSLLQHSLLWRRDGTDPALTKISFPPERHTVLPSWSWMAYQGSIEYLDTPPGMVEWSENEIYSPWLPDRFAVNSTTDELAHIKLTGVARNFDISKAKETDFLILYDLPKTEGQPLQCVVLGRRSAKGRLEEARHYVLFITPKLGSVNEYERVGVGFMPGRFIDLSLPNPAQRVKIR